MTMLFWNDRAVNKKSRRRDIKKHIQSFVPYVVGLIETKIKPNKSYRISKCFPTTWAFYNNNALSNRGRIWVVWDTAFWTGTILYVSLQQITLQLHNKGGLTMPLTVTYGENNQANRNVLWSDIRHIHASYQSMPWILVGDFNVCRFTNEKVGGKRLSIHKLKEFNDCINLCGLNDVKSIGSTWSWHNNSHGQSRIYGKLDRALCNDSWMHALPEAYVEYKSTSSSDHTPVLLHLMPATNSGSKPFRFFNHWLRRQGYNELLKKIWEKDYAGSYMFTLVSEFKALKVALKKWSQSNTLSIRRNVLSISCQLRLIQSQLMHDLFNDQLHQEETKMKIQLEEWLGKEEEELRQKSREIWLQQDDRNSKFFHNAIKNRITRNTLRNLIKLDGTLMTNVDEIKVEAPKYYENLFNQTDYWTIFRKLVVRRI